MEVPRLGVKLELQLLTYATATATPDLSHTCDLHHGSWQCRILNPLSKARHQSCNLMVPSQIHFHCAMTWTPISRVFKNAIVWVPIMAQLFYSSLNLKCISFFLFFFFFCLFRAIPTAYGSSQARGQIRAIAAGLHHSHSNVGSEPCLWHTPQDATPDP